MSEALDRLAREVAETKTVTESAVALISSIPDLIRNAIGDDDALNALADDLDAQQQSLAAAVAANTPAQTEPSEPTAPVDNGETPPAA